jgi:hypothetical protein
MIPARFVVEYPQRCFDCPIGAGVSGGSACAAGDRGERVGSARLLYDVRSSQAEAVTLISPAKGRGWARALFHLGHH